MIFSGLCRGRFAANFPAGDIPTVPLHVFGFGDSVGASDQHVADLGLNLVGNELRTFASGTRWL